MPFAGRVLLVGPLEGARWRSISHYTRTLAESLRAHGVEVELAVAPWWNPPSLVAGVRSRWTRQPQVQAALRGQFDIVHLTDQALAHHVDRFAGHAAVVVSCHDLMAFTVTGYFHGRLEGAVKRAFLRKPVGALKRADAVIAVSQYTATTIRSLGAAAVERVRVIPNVVRPVFQPMAAGEAEAVLAAQGIALPGRPRVLSVGHAGGYKNLPLLLRALSKDGARDANLVRVGSLRPEQRKLARSLGIDGRITLLPGIDDPTLAALMNSCDVLVQPSLAEGFGLPVVEAMACGLPVVVSDGGALPEVVGDYPEVIKLGNGEETATELAAAIARAISDEGLRTVGIARAAAFSSDAVVPRFIELYDELSRKRMARGLVDG